MAKMTKAQIENSLELLKADIAEAVESATTMKAKVQHALVGCVSHFKMTGSNVGLADIINSFIKELGQGVNLRAVVAWCGIHLHMVEHEDGKSLVFSPIKSTVLDTEKAAADMWYKHKPQNAFSFDIVTAIIALADKAVKAQTKVNEEGANVILDDDLMQSLALIGEKAKAKAPA